MTDKERYMQVLEWEHATTLKVMKAFPAGKLSFKPHERSLSAGEVMMRFAGEQMIMASLPSGGFEAPPAEGPKQEMTLDQILNVFEQGFREVHKALAGLSEEDFNNKMTSFFGMKMKMADAFWIPVKDQIHHRGQLSVYIRLAGGKVPSIYGPSADEPGM